MNNRMSLDKAGKRIDTYLVLLLLLTIFALGPLMQPGYFWGAHDARHSVYFLFEFDRSIQDGIWYPRWSPDFAFGHGYPFFNIYAPLAYYVGEVFVLLGFGFTDAVKIVFGLSIVLSGLAMYLFLRRIMGRQAALVGGLCYVYLPYHLFDVYVRAALAESVALTFLPLVLWGVHEASLRPKLKSVLGAGLAYAGLMFSSNLIALMFTPVLAAYGAVVLLLRASESQPFRRLSRESLFPLAGHLLHLAIPPLMAMLVGLGLSAIFWVPAITEAAYVRADQWLGRYDYRDDFVYFYQIFSPRWGFGVPGPGPDDDVGFQLGAVPLALSFFSLVALRWIPRVEARRLVVFCQLLLLGSVFMTLTPAALVWEAVPLAQFAQFPWRYFSMTMPALGVLSAAVLAVKRTPSQASEDESRWPGWAPALVLSAAILLGSYPYLQVEISEPREGPVSLAALMRFQHQADHMTGATIWTDVIPTWSSMADIYQRGEDVTTKVDYSDVPQTEILAVHSRSMDSVHELVWMTAGDDQQKVRFYRFYYPGWRAYLLDVETEDMIRELPIETSGPHGLITVSVPQGTHLLLLRFEDTLPRIAGKTWTAVTLIGMVVVLLIRGGLQRRGGRGHD